MAERDFDAERKKREGHTFKLGGETFHTYPGMSYTFINRSDKEMEEKAESDGRLTAVVGWIRNLIVVEEREKFDAVLTNPEIYIEAQDVLDLSSWLLEAISGRPTKRPASSGNGAGRPGTGSKAKPSTRAGKTGKG